MGDVFWHENKIGEAERAKNMAQRGLVMWLTGPSGSGKSTIAAELEAALARLGFLAYILDGDNLRHGINSDLGFSKGDRDENIRRICEIAGLFCGAQIIAIVAAISPFEKARLEARAKIGAENFCEIYIKAGAEARRSRDPKGLYKNGTVSADAPYEEPKNPDILIDTEKLPIEESVKIIVEHMLERQIGYFLPKILEAAIYAAYDAGEAILEVYARDFEVAYKDDNSPLTEADKKSNELICARLKKYAPYIGILAEESEDDRSRLANRFCFVIDPLDGTKEFIKKNGEFTVNIGLSCDGRPIMGVVYAPCKKKFWYAAKNYGAYASDLNGAMFRLFDEGERIKASEKTQGLTAIKSRSHSDEKTEALLERNSHKIKNVMDIGSALKGCMIAQGLADIYYRFGYTMEWDTCAMQCVVEEAGGIFVQGDFSEMRYNRENSLNDKGFVILNRMENKLQ